jgi:hypothetical protein
MKKIFILSMLLILSSVYAYGWEMYVSNESSNSITVYDHKKELIDTITDPLIVYTIQLAFKENSILYVASLSGSKVIKIDQNDNIIGYIQNSNVAMGLAIGNNKHLYVGVAGFIEEYDENDNFIKSFNGGLTSIKPCAMTMGPNGNLFTVDNNNDRVIEFSLNGNIINQFSTGPRSYPRGIAFGPDGFLYVTGDGMNNVSVFDPNTFALTRTITGVTAPYGINFDPENHHLFVANFGANNILEYLYTGEFIGVFASGLSAPNHIAFKSSATSTTTTTVSGNTVYPAPVPKTGQTISYAAGDDGALQKGSASPIPRFTDNNNGTVTDNLTGLIWLKYANPCGPKNWADAIAYCNNLGSGTAGLSDGSVVGDWRLPNVKELHSLIDFGRYNPSLPAGHPFTGVQSDYYWSGTSSAASTNDAWSVAMNYGYVNGTPIKSDPSYFVWPVKGPVTSTPTNISLSSLKAIPSDKQVIFKWKTETETGNAGFNVWRADNFVKINRSLIPALGSSVSGSDYNFVDESVLNGKRYFYLLEDIDTDGISTFHGPVKATPRLIYGIGK